MSDITSISVWIDGASQSLAGSIRLDEIELFNRDSANRLYFTHEAVLPRADAWQDATVRVDINSAVAFWGRITGRPRVHTSDGGWSYAYEAVSMDAMGNYWPIKSPFDSTGSATFNADSSDPGYDPTYDGLTLGEMIEAMFFEPDTRNFLASYDIGKYQLSGEIDSRTLGDLAAGYLGSYIPTKPVTFSGGEFFDAIRGVLQSAAPNYRLWFQYVLETPPAGGDARIFTIPRFTDVRTVSSTLSIDVAENPMPRINRSYAENFSRVVVRGGPDIRPIILDKNDGDLAEDFAMPPWMATTADAKAAWNIGIWYNADIKQIKGTCLCRRPRTPEEITEGVVATDPILADPNWLLVTAEDTDLTWGTDDYVQDSGGLAGYVYVSYEPTADWVNMVNRKVVANTALTAGGTAYLSLDDPLPSTLFTKFTMVAGIWPGSLTWWKYSIEKLTAEGKSIAKFAQPAFPVPQAWSNTDGTPLSFSTAGVALIYYTPDGATEQRYATCGFQVDRQNECLILDRPSVSFFGQPANLELGGDDTDGIPENIRVLLPVSLAPLQAIVPPDVDDEPQYEGTCHTEDGISRTLYVDMPDWVSEQDTGPMTEWANQILDSVKDTVVEGSATVYTYEPVRGPGCQVSFTDDCYETNPYDDMTTMVHSCLVKFNHSDDGILYHTEFALSNRNDQYRGYQHSNHPVMVNPVKPFVPQNFTAGSLISHNRGAAMGGNTEGIRAAFGTKLDK